jgi:acetoin utilization deacetylase AcuC-like enzyme
MGFCLINHVAVAARAAVRDGVERVAVIDWDAHHGNGTQAIFWDDPAVLYASIHQFGGGFYPGTGAASETGGDAAAGLTVNVPLAAGTAQADHLAAFRSRLLEPVARFAPQLVLVSAGFDAHRDDPLCSLRLSAAAFGEMATAVLELGAPVAFVLEGGYDLAGLREGLGAVMDAVTS